MSRQLHSRSCIVRIAGSHDVLWWYYLYCTAKAERVVGSVLRVADGTRSKWPLEGKGDPDDMGFDMRTNISKMEMVAIRRKDLRHL